MRMLLLLAILFAAFACYIAGMSQGAALLIVTGALLELAFWFGLLRPKR